MSKLETSEEEKNKWRERISKEVKLAVKVQENFLPKRNLKNYPVHGINISAKYQEIFLAFTLIIIVFILSLLMLLRRFMQEWLWLKHLRYLRSCHNQK